jgi:DNA-binding MarR family transcriptional regulator
MEQAHPNGPDEVIHQSTRLKIMAALKAMPEDEPLEFTRLKALLQATDGNLGAHLTTLENAGYVSIAKDFVGKKPRTRVFMTRQGRRAFERHVEYLRNILDGA